VTSNDASQIGQSWALVVVGIGSFIVTIGSVIKAHRGNIPAVERLRVLEARFDEIAARLGHLEAERLRTQERFDQRLQQMRDELMANLNRLNQRMDDYFSPRFRGGV
jgi:chromosome segregation ATPase